jgi:pimeloyl-ACP methyl ester carboxylesterase
MHVIERAGRAPVVLCIHGYCQSSAYWVPTVDRLAEQGVHAIAVDLPGFAQSAADPGPYTMEGLADAVVSELDRRGIDRIVLVGGSMGGVVAQHLVLRHPKRVVRLLLVATGAYTTDPASALAKADALAAGSWDVNVIEPIARGFFKNQPRDADFVRYREIASMAAKPAAIDAARSNAQSRTLEELCNVAVPTLIIQGRHDKARTPEHGSEMRDRIQGARLEVLEGSGHTPHLEEPEAFHHIAIPFLLG